MSLSVRFRFGVWWVGLAAALLVLGLPGAATVAAAEAGTAAPDYTQDAYWLCRPGREDRCTASLDATALHPDGTTSPQSYPPADDKAAVDCFYVYPTASEEPSTFADLRATPGIIRAARIQAGRLAAHCRLFAPIYRQRTLAGLAAAQQRGGRREAPSSMPYDDVLAAWRAYLARDNHGRGVILIGHSQGTVVLQKLIAAEIDGKSVQDRIVSIFLPGDPSLTVPRGAVVGGTFKHLPLCAFAAQIGCVYVWSTFAEGDNPSTRAFGRNASADLVAACNSPAAPGDGRAMLKAILPQARAGDREGPDWIAVDGQISGQCVADAQGAAFRVQIGKTPFAGQIHTVLGQARKQPSWGLHRFDIPLVQGNMIDVIDQESHTWSHLKQGSVPH